ncbi:RHS repeat-associated core domain-containing protein [Saccharothrix sp. ALI-22-I]|uniref:RHS repeat-associated core domain-containing protein n=1 Tax=Saccharothrix sp. ALI-22-I TaxID=1933778 RepID=UPI00097C6381|nr:RHS repeat-associated core domain-containing protein [Saccharothrix sp. ALI-22-I]
MITRRWLSAALVPLLIAPMVVGVRTASAAEPERLRPQTDRAVPGRIAPPVFDAVAETGKPYRGTPPAWPAAGEAVVDLSAGTPSRAGGLPVTVDRGRGVDGAAATGAAAPGKVRVRVLDQDAARAAGVRGLVLKVGRADGVSAAGHARVTVDYSAFRDAYGADWASRLRLVCVDAPCEARPVPGNLAAGTATADVAVEGERTLALTAAPSGPAGDYAATSLQPSATWTAGGSSGDFTWSYPVRVPPAVGGAAPRVEFGYSAQSVDGRMAASNNQPSWLGEGFDWSPGFVERKYKPCAEDMAGGNNTTATGDQCWATDNATVSFNGRGGELVHEDGKGWRLRGDDGSRIEHRTGSPNGDENGEHWVVTTTDGTQYWFGRNRLPGWTDGRAETNSVQVATVFGNHPGEPCHLPSFTTAHCNQAYRWNLDHVVDPNGNTTSYWYAKETNKYARNNNPNDLVAYDRSAHLTRIDYGTRADTAYGTVPAQVVFTAQDRCLADCGVKNRTTWPDVPFDQECTTAPCTVGSPTFWTTKRLGKVTTRIWDAGAARHTDVESWTLTHSFPDPGDGTRAGLWLSKIAHTGHVGGDKSVPDVTFTGVQMPNRVDTADHAPAMNWWRVAHIDTETGGKIAVTYSAPDCVAGTRVPTAPESNTLLCYPVRWTPAGQTGPVTDHFHKYVVKEVTESDLTGHAPRTITAYRYLGDPAWHYTDDDGLVKAENKTWSVWRGYGGVRTTRGDPGEQTVTETHYFRGMHGDKLPSGTRSVTVPAAGAAPAVADEDAFAGVARQTITFNGTAEVASEASEPWQSAPNASRTRNGTTVHARFTGTLATHTRTALDGGRPARTTVSRSTFDAHGMVTQVDDTGDTAVTGDEKCVRTTYEPRNTSAWLMSYAHRVETTALRCGTTPTTEKEVVGDEKTTYDHQPFGTAPTVGRATQVEQLKTWTASARTYVVTSRSSYDVHGRVKEAWDVKGNRSRITYTPEVSGPTTATTSFNALDWPTTTTLAPAWGSPTKVVDANGRTTELAYDPLGRLKDVWLPGRAKPATPSLRYEYDIRRDLPVAVTTSKLNSAGGYTSFHTLYDGLLRQRQTQSPEAGTGGGRIVVDTFYDTAGRAWQTNSPYLANGAPGKELFLPQGDNVIPAQTRKQFDGAGRETASSHRELGVEKWRTTTGYGGDRVDVTPPAGGTATSTMTDASGRTTALRQYHGSTPSGTFDATTYGYTRKGELETITDPAGNRWTYDYDLRGRKRTVSDPDKGTTAHAHNDAGELVSVTDADNRTLTFSYDALGRRTAVHAGSVLRSEWVYDTVAKGHLTRSTRVEGANRYTREITGYTPDYKPSGVTYTIPVGETGLAGTYTYGHTYTASGLLETTTLPDLDGDGGLPTETLTSRYTDLDKPHTLSTSIDATTYADLTAYTRLGELAVLGRRNNGGRVMDTGLYYEEGTRRVTRMLTVKEVAPSAVLDINLGYDNAGNVVRIADTPAGGAADVQCFRHDNLRRLKEAWTPENGECGPNPSVGALGGAAKYWHSWEFDKVGNRTKFVDHVTAAGQATTTYAYPTAGAPQPHTLRTTGTTDSAGTRTATYTYDLLGNTKTRPSSAGTQTLDWDVEGHLSTSTDNTGPTQYVYDADGNRLIRRDPTGSTLYLPDQELRHTKTTGTKTATRYYHHAGHPIATRTPSGLRWLATDHQGTPLTTVHSNSQAVAQRRQTPYGTVRTTIGAWPSTMDKGFVGGTIDNTGLTHLGAREYDPFIGRFLSVDPVIDREDPQQLHGYSYSNGNPVTMSDPDGRLPGWMKKIGSVVQQQAQAHVDMAKKAASVVNSAATAAASKAWSGIKATGTLLYERSGEFSALLGVIALFTPPPANAIVAGGSLAFGAVNAYQKCSKQKWVDCGLAVAGMVPGFGVVRAGAGVAKARSVIQAGNAALGAADDGIRLARAGANNALPAGHHRGIRPSATSKR